jgi:hypothetical protein
MPVYPVDFQVLTKPRYSVLTKSRAGLARSAFRSLSTVDFLIAVYVRGDAAGRMRCVCTSLKQFPD